MALGYGLYCLKFFDDDFLKKLNQMCFRVFLPCLLFDNIYRSDFRSNFSPALVGYAVCSTLVIFSALLLVIPRIEAENINRSVMIQGAFRSNFILFGLPVTLSLYGAGNTGTTALLFAFIVPLYNLLAIFALSVFSQEKKSPKAVVHSVLCNPLILASALAILVQLVNLRLPSMVEATLSDIAGVTTPLAIIVLGGTFRFGDVKKYKKRLSITVFCRLLLIPAIFLSLGMALGFRGRELAALLALFSSPTAVSSFTMAQSAKANAELAGQIVVFTSILSVFSLFFWISLLGYYQLL